MLSDDVMSITIRDKLISTKNVKQLLYGYFVPMTSEFLLFYNSKSRYLQSKDNHFDFVQFCAPTLEASVNHRL